MFHSWASYLLYLVEIDFKNISEESCEMDGFEEVHMVLHLIHGPQKCGTVTNGGLNLLLTFSVWLWTLKKWRHLF